MPGTNRPGSDPAGPFRPAVDAVSTFFDYQLNPEKYAKPNQRVKPGPMQGYRYDLQPGESQTDSGVLDAQGQPVEFVNRPKLATLADLIGYMTGGVAGAPKGAIGAGAYRTQRDVLPALAAEDPTVAAALARRMEAMHKRASQGYDIPKGGGDAYQKMDKALTSVSTAEPLPRYADSAERALNMGFDTPMYHATNATPEPDTIRKLAGTPFREMDPFVTSRGSFYLGDKPSAILKSGAAQNTYGGKMYPYLVKDVMGEHPMPPGLHQQMPDVLDLFDKWGNPNPSALAEIRASMQEAPGWGDNMGAAMEATKKFFGPQNFDAATFLQKQGNARDSVAEKLARLYYEQAPGAAPGTSQRIDPFAFQPVDPYHTGMPGFSAFENGARPNKAGEPMTGIHSPMQNEIGAMGFSGARIRDEMQHAGGKSIAMIDPTGVRAVGAKFKNPNGDLLSGTAPPGWWADMWGRQQQENSQQ